MQQAKYVVETYQLIASNGRPIRKATKVTNTETGQTIKFMDRMTKREAKEQAIMHWMRGY